MKRQNIFLAKKMLTELIYDATCLKGCQVTYPQTQTILDGAVINGVMVRDIQTILNLCDAWRYCLENIDSPLNLAYLCKVNGFVSRNEGIQWGTLRTGRICIGAFIPPVPKKEGVVHELHSVASIENPIERAVEYFVYISKGQLFWDGNKRTALIAANKVLIESGSGILIIGKDKDEEFRAALNCWYFENEEKTLKASLRKCIREGLK